MRRLVSALWLWTLAGAPPAWGEPAGAAFPWAEGQVLKAADGGTLTWTVERGEGLVTVKGAHPRWTVVHTAKPDGTPVSTVKMRGKRKDTITYGPQGAELVTDDGAEQSARTVEGEGLWDPGSLEARLAGVAWAEVKKLKVRMFDPDASSPRPFTFLAELEGTEACGGRACHHVVVALDGWRKRHGPTYHFWFGTGAGAPYLKFSSAKESFAAAGAP